MLLSKILTNGNFLRLMVATVDEVAGFRGTPLQKFKLISRKWFGAKDTKLSGSAEEQLETALNSDLLKPVKPDKKKNKKTSRGGFYRICASKTHQF